MLECVTGEEREREERKWQPRLRLEGQEGGKGSNWPEKSQSREWPRESATADMVTPLACGGPDLGSGVKEVKASPPSSAIRCSEVGAAVALD